MWDSIVAYADQHSGLAAWLQTIGAIVGILLAVAVPAAQEHLRRKAYTREMTLRAKSMAHLIKGDLGQLQLTIDRVRALGGLRPINLPDSLQGMTDRLWIMGETGTFLANIVALIRHHQILCERRGATDYSEGPSEDVLKEADLQLLAAASGSCDVAIAGVKILTKPPTVEQIAAGHTANP